MHTIHIHKDNQHRPQEVSAQPPVRPTNQSKTKGNALLATQQNRYHAYSPGESIPRGPTVIGPHPQMCKKPTQTVDRYTIGRYVATDPSMNPDEEDKIVEAMEQLRINYNLRQWRVCSLICESLADKFKSVAEQNDKSS